MIRRWLVPGLIETGAVADGVWAIRDGVVNLFVVRGPGGLVCVDAGWRPAVVARGFAKLGLDMAQVAAVFLTHGHWDHARGARALGHAVVYAGEGESGIGDGIQTVRDGQVIMAAGLTVRVVATPGHTGGSVSYMVGERLLFTGDALRLRRGKIVPYYRWLNRDQGMMKRSIQKLAGIEGVECVLTGHTGLVHEVAAAFADFTK